MRRALSLSLLPLSLTLLVACGDDGGGGDAQDLPPIECEAPDLPADPCDAGQCFSACGVPILIDAAPFFSGLEAVERPVTRPLYAQRVTQTLATLNALELQIRQGETTEVLGAVPLPGPLSGLTELDGLIFVAGGRGRIYPVVANDPTAPMVLATWRPQVDADQSLVGMVGATSNRLVLSTPSGLSLIDLSDPATPVEDRCLPVPVEGGMEQVWHVEVAPHFIAASGGTPPLTFVWDLQRPERPPSALHIDSETVVRIYGESLYLTLDGQLVEYGAVPGQPLTEVRRADTQGAQGREIVGGFMLLTDAGLALDLKSALKRYTIIDPEPGSCTLSLNAEDNSDSWIIAPNLVPDRRFSVDDFPTYDCGPASARFGAPYDGVVEPTGSRIFMTNGEETILWDPATGDHNETALPALGDPTWVGSSLVMFETQLVDQDVPDKATLRWVPADSPSDTPSSLEIAPRVVDWSASAEALWYIAEPTPRHWAEARPAPSDHGLWRWAPPATEAEAIPLTRGAAPIGVVATTERVYLIDAQRSVRVLDTSTLEPVGVVELPLGADLDQRAASSLGLFISDECGGLAWVSPEAELHTLPPTSARHLRPVGADAATLYAVMSDSPHPDYSAAPSLVALSPSAEGDAFTLTEGASYPLTGEAGSLSVRGGGIAFFHRGVTVLTRP